MNIPIYINEALRKRTKAALQFMEYDYIVSKWISLNNLEDYVNSEDFHLGVEAIVNPKDSEERIREAILKKE